MRVKNERLVGVLDELYSFNESLIQVASTEFLSMMNEACDLLGTGDEEEK